MSKEEEKLLPRGFLQTDFRLRKMLLGAVSSPGKAGLLEKQLQLVQRACNKVQLMSILLTFPGQCINFSPKAKWLLTRVFA